MSVRYRIERRCYYNITTGETQWVDESIAGRKTLKHSREELRRIRREDKKSGFSAHTYRIIRVTTTREVVK